MEESVRLKRADFSFMARQDRIAVYTTDGNSIMRYVNEEEASDMMLERYPLGGAKYHAGSVRIHGKGRQEYLQLQPEPKHKDSNTFSPTSLTTGDLLALLGCNPKTERDHVTHIGRIRAARLKVKLWPRIGDTKAVRVCPA
jgi:hypothetical protein